MAISAPSRLGPACSSPPSSNGADRFLLRNRLQAVADLGLGVMEQALVEAAAYTIGPGRPSRRPCRRRSFASSRMLDREAGLADASGPTARALPDRRVYRVRLADLDAIPGAPLAYWMSPSLRRLFPDLPA